MERDQGHTLPQTGPETAEYSKLTRQTNSLPSSAPGGLTAQNSGACSSSAWMPFLTWPHCWLGNSHSFLQVAALLQSFPLPLCSHPPLLHYFRALYLAHHCVLHPQLFCFNYLSGVMSSQPSCAVSPRGSLVSVPMSRCSLSLATAEP